MKLKSLLLGTLAGAALSLGGAMRGVQFAMPGMGARSTPTFSRRNAPEYDGLGRKKKRKVHPKHNARNDRWGGRGRVAFREAVERTHSVKRDGTYNEDPRDDKYLHSHARQMRAFRRSLAKAGR